jgi:hypothetical protein
VFEKFASATPEPTKKPIGAVKKNQQDNFNGFLSAIKKNK